MCDLTGSECAEYNKNWELVTFSSIMLSHRWNDEGEDDMK